jgi:hypothetical protein
MPGIRLNPLFPSLSYRRSSNVGRELGFCHLPNEVWKFVELQGNITRSTTYAPITSRERPRKIASVELLEKLSIEYSAIRDQHDKVQLWLKQKEEEHGHKTRITVCGVVPPARQRCLIATN